MTHRPLILTFTVLLLAGFAPACNQKKPNDDSPNPTPAQVDSAPGPVVGGGPVPGGTEYVLFAHLRAKDIRDSAIFAEVKQALTKSGGQAELDEIEKAFGTQAGGLKSTDIDSASVWVTEVPQGGETKFVLMVSAAKPINKAGVFGLGKVKPDARGFYAIRPDEGLFHFLHFPDDKTLVALHPDLAQKYLDGYAKNRTGWPMTAELTKAAAGHTLFVAAKANKLLQELSRPGAEALLPFLKDLQPLLAAQSFRLTIDLKGKELKLEWRATFPDATTADKAKEIIQAFIAMATEFVEQFMKSKEATELGFLMPAVKEALRALKEAKVEVSGADLTISGSYKADFDIETMFAEGLKQYREIVPRMKASNNLKQIGIALQQFSDVHGGPLPVHAISAKGAPLKNAKDKPLLSWRVAMLPYIEQGNLYNEFQLDEPWDSPHNKKLIEKMPKLYAPPKPGKPGYTHFQMVIGPNALSPVDTRMPASFLDGTSNTIAVVEAAEPVIWTKPDDVMLPGKELPKDFRKKFGGLYQGGFNVVMWDGSARFVKNSVSDRTLGLMLDPRDGQPVPNDW